MALKKKIELENGIVLNYHRIVTITKITNEAILIEVKSYISKEKREEEIAKKGQPVNIFVEANFIEKSYDENETIKDLYDYLKTTEMFKDAENS